MEILPKMQISLPSSLIGKQTSLWKAVLLISVLAVVIFAALAYLFIGSVTQVLPYALTSSAIYIGYHAQKHVRFALSQQEYCHQLQSNVKLLQQEQVQFQAENQTLLKNNQMLSQHVSSLQEKLELLQGLLAKIDSSALLTEQLLTSCIETSSKQQVVLDQLASPKELFTQVQEIENTLSSLAHRIEQFFLHDTKASSLLAIKEDFVKTSHELACVKQELEQVQKELACTSLHLEKTAKSLDAKLILLALRENHLRFLKDELAPSILSLAKNTELFSKLSLKDQKHLEILEQKTSALPTLSPGKTDCNQ